MKKIVGSLFLLIGLCSVSKAAGVLVVEAPVLGYGTPTTVSISTTSWTKVPTTQTSGRMGVIVNAPATLNANLAGHLGDCTSTAIATSVRPIEIIRTEDYNYFSMREDVCLWLLSLHTAAESIHYQEVKQ